MKIFFAPAAKLDLLSIGENIGQENPTRAVSFVDELIDRCYSLADLPRRYPSCRAMSTGASGAACTGII